jgi:hypothetical protein
MMNELKDILGRTVEVGDIVAYSTGRRGPWAMAYGTVEDLTYEAGRSRSPWRVKIQRTGGRSVTLSNVGALVVVEKACSEIRRAFNPEEAE